MTRTQEHARLEIHVVPDRAGARGVNGGLGLALRAGAGVRSLRRGRGVVFATALPSGALDIRVPRYLTTPSLGRLTDGRIGVAATATIAGAGNGAPGGDERQVFGFVPGTGFIEAEDSAALLSEADSLPVTQAEERQLTELYGLSGEGVPSAGERAETRFPFIHGRADPTIVEWSGSRLFIATDEHGDERADGPGLLIRSAATIDALADSPDHRILARIDGVVDGCFWAPELHVLGGRLHCLFSGSVGSREWTSVQSQVITLRDGGDPTRAGDWSPPRQVLRADGGPLRLDDEHPGISLDMTAFAAGGRTYVAWSQRYITDAIGDAELWIATIDPAQPDRLISDPTRLASPLRSWEMAGANVLEGPAALERDGVILLTYAAAAVGADYATGLLAADARADLLDPAAWRRLPHPLLDSDPALGIWGPGHSTFSTDEEGRDLLVFHAKTEPEPGPRHAGLRRIRFGGGGAIILDSAAHGELEAARG